MSIEHVRVRVLIAAISVVVGVGCREQDAPPPPPQVPTPPAPEMDAGDAGVSSATNYEPTTSPSSVGDAGPDALSGSTTPERDAAPDAGRKNLGDAGDAGPDAGNVRGAGDAGDAGNARDAGVGDAGVGDEPRTCSSLGSEGANEPGLCGDRFEHWCESQAVVSDCEGRAATRDEGVFAAYLDCLDEVFNEPDLCDVGDGARVAAAVACARSADDTACLVDSPACDVYEGCAGYTVAECNANIARFNERHVRYASPYFQCPAPPSDVLGG